MRILHMHAVWRRSGLLATAIGVVALPLSAQSLDGSCLTEGYGYYVQVAGKTLKTYEVTAISCIPAVTAERAGEGDAKGVPFRSVRSALTLTLRSGSSPDRAVLHVSYAASDILMHRIAAAPATCAQPLADTPINNFNVFADSWAELYGFFDIKKADWASIVAAHRSRVSAATTPHELFAILRDMIEPFHDAHTRITAARIGEKFRGGRRSATSLDSAGKQWAFAVVEQHYVRTPLRSWCNGQVQYARLDSGIGYLRLKSFEDYVPDDDFASSLALLQAALDTIFTDAPSWKGLVIDVRINTGGADPFGLEIASRLAAKEYVAYAKQARANPKDPSRWTEPQPSVVRPSSRPGFRGPVVELTGIHSVSAAETFTQSLLDRTPHVTRVGENTQGVFSDVLTRDLPNGWSFGLPNERFVTDGKNYDGPGIPPDIEIPVFPRSDLDAGRDGALEKALALLGAKNTRPAN